MWITLHLYFIKWSKNFLEHLQDNQPCLKFSLAWDNSGGSSSFSLFTQHHKDNNQTTDFRGRRASKQLDRSIKSEVSLKFILVTPIIFPFSYTIHCWPSNNKVWCRLNMLLSKIACLWNTKQFPMSRATFFLGNVRHYFFFQLQVVLEVKVFNLR